MTYSNIVLEDLTTEQFGLVRDLNTVEIDNIVGGSGIRPPRPPRPARPARPGIQANERLPRNQRDPRVLLGG